MSIRIILSVILLGTFVLQAFGTPPVQSDWAGVQALAAGTKVRVNTKSKHAYEGRIDRVTDSSLAITIDNGQPQVLDRSDVKRVYRIDKGSGSRGAKIGIWAAIGLGVGGAIGAAALGATGGSDETGKVLAPFLIAGAGAGAAVGAAMGKGEKKVLVYEVK